MANEIKKNDLESLMKELDGVVAAISGEGVSLEESLALYERGVLLVKECSSRLEDAKRRINILAMTDEGELIEKSFDAPLGE